MSLKNLVAKRILDEILGAIFKLGEWRVLVLDQLATSIVSSCCKMHDVMSKGITLVEGLEKSREPQPAREAVYIIWPSEESISKLLMDFDENSRLYKGGHVYLLDRMTPVVMSKIQQSTAKKAHKCICKTPPSCTHSLIYTHTHTHTHTPDIKTLKESYIGFLPKESRVFTLNFPESFRILFSAGSVGKREMKTRIADQLATLCAFLGEFPALYCHRAVEGVQDIAHELYKRLEDFRKQSPTFATGDTKGQSQLIILDRGFDVVSPLVHELTYQAMVYDLLQIKKDVYTYQATTERGAMTSRDIILDENDSVWVELRHQYISDVKKKVGDMVKTFTESRTKSSSSAVSADLSIKKLHQLMKEIPQHHKELSKLSRHLSLVENCDKKLRAGMFDLCKAEQDLAVGERETGEKIEDPISLTVHTFFDRKIGISDKIRLMMLQLLFSEGMEKEGIIKLMQRIEIPPKERSAIINLTCLGYPMLRDERVENTAMIKSGRRQQLKRKERGGEKYVTSRWIPVVKDIMEYAISGSLDRGYCPIMSPHPDSSPSRSHSTTTTGPVGQSVRSDRARWNWVDGRKRGGTFGQPSPKEEVLKPRLIVFVVGGVTYSEIRAAYEVAEQFPSHDVIIGSTHIITPADFIGHLSQLDRPYMGRV